MLTENPSDTSKKIGGDRLGTNSRGIYVSNSGEIADRFQRSLGSSVRSDIGFLQKTPATDIDTPIRERLAAERRRIFPFDIVSNAESLSYKDLVDLGYVAKEAQYTTRFGNKLPGYERAYMSNTLDAPTLTISDLQTVKGNLEDKKGRWGIGGVSSVPELEDQLFDGLNIGTSYGDFLHLMRALKSQNLSIRKRNFDFDDAVYKKQKELNNLFRKQVDKQIEVKNKILKNPYLKTAQNIYLNRAPIFGTSGTLGVTGASIYGIMNSPLAKSRDRFQDAMDDDEFAEYFRKSSISANDYSSSTDYINAIIEEWNKQNPNKQFAEGGEVEPDPLEVLERSRPKIAGIPINDKPLSGTDPIGEAIMWGLGGGAASAALRSMFPTYGATAGWLAFGDNNKDNMLVVPNNPTRNTTPIETGLLNKEVRQYYADDVLPRDILTSEADKLKFLNTDKNFEYDLYPSGYFNGNVAGHYDLYADKIRLNGGYAANKDLLDNVMAHEVNHRYNREFPLDKEHNRILNRAYTVEPDLDTPAARAARKPSEKRATNVNIRHRLQTDLRNTLGHNPTKAEMDKFIDSLSDQELLDRLGSASSYGSAYLMSIEDRADLVKQPVDQYKKARTTALRKALKRIAMNENKNDNNQNYA